MSLYRSRTACRCSAASISPPSALTSSSVTTATPLRSRRSIASRRRILSHRLIASRRGAPAVVRLAGRVVVPPATLLAPREEPGVVQPRERLTDCSLTHAERRLQLAAAGAALGRGDESERPVPRLAADRSEGFRRRPRDRGRTASDRHPHSTRVAPWNPRSVRRWTVCQSYLYLLI